MADVSMRILLSVVGGSSVTGAFSSIASAATGNGGLSGALLGIGEQAVKMAVGLGVTSVEASGAFQNAMLQNVARAGLARDQMNNVSQAVLGMAPALGQMPTALAQALYPVLSSFSGISDSSAKAKISLTELKDAGESVAGTTTNVTSVTNAASAAFNAFGMTSTDTNTNVSRMNTLFDIMNSTVSAGNMQWSNYSTMIGKLSVGAHGAGVSFIEENSALADLTNQGYSAQLAGTYLNNTFTTMYTKADTVAKNAKKLGETFDENKYKTLDLAGRIQYLNQATDGNQASLLKVLNGNSVALKTFDALSNSIGSYKSNLDSLGNSQGATATAFQTASSGFSFSMQKMQAAGQVLLITIGTQLLPILTQLINSVSPVTAGFMAWLASGNHIQTMLTTIGTFINTNLITPLTHLGQALAPIVLFIVQTGILQAALKDVAIGAIALVIGVGRLIDVIATVIGFFEHNQIAAAALVSALIGIGVAIGASVIPGMIAAGIAAVAAFGVWAVAAAAAAIATLAAAWPFILIGVIVAAVVFGIIMAIQHWGAIVSWLSGVWGAFSGWFMGLMGTIGSFFTGIWSGIVSRWQGLWSGAVGGVKSTGNGLATWWSGIWSAIQNALQATWSVIVNVVKIGALLVLGFILGPFLLIGAAFVWLYNHNYYFKALIDSIVSVVRAGLSWLVSAWNGAIAWLVSAWQQVAGTATAAWSMVKSAITTAVQSAVNGLLSAWSWAVSWLTGAWNTVSSVASTAWGMVTSTITGAIQTAVSWLTSAWSTASSWISGQWNNLSSMASSAWQAVSGVFSSIWSTYISGPLTALGTSISSWFSGLIGQAAAWGTGLIQGFINGISSMVGNVGKAVGDIASKVAGSLGFHSPSKEGPGRELDVWGPNLVKGFSAGMIRELPTLQAAVNLTAKQLTPLSVAPSSATPQHYSSNNTPSTIVFSPTLTLQGLDEDSLEKAGQWLMRYFGDQVRAQYGNV